MLCVLCCAVHLHSMHALSITLLRHRDAGEVDMSTFTVVPRAQLIADMGDAHVPPPLLPQM